MMASGKNAKKQRRSLPVVTQREGLPWLTIAAVTIIVALAGTIFAVVYNAKSDKSQAAAVEAAAVAALQPWVPTADNPDPSSKIADIFAGDVATYKDGLHVTAPTRVAYDRFPPIGGPHDAEWAACNGIVYPVAVRNENMVHTLEHGAIWITYNPATIAAGDLDILKALVVGKQYITLSPYPDLKTAISLQSWRHQLFVPTAGDERVRQFITALQRNTTTTPEVNGTCEQPTFDIVNPPPFDATPPGADAVQMDGTGATPATGEQMTSGAASTDTGSASTETGSAATAPATTAAVSPSVVGTGSASAGATATSGSG